MFRVRACELLSSIYHLPSTAQKIALVREALESSGVVPPEIPPETMAMASAEAR